MKKTLKKISIALMIVSFVITAIANSAGASTDTTQNNLDQTKDFLSNVLGLDLAKYDLTDSPYRHNNTRPANTFPPQTKDVNMETAGYFFKTDEGMLEILSIFYNRKLTVVNINPTGDNPYVYTSETEKDLANQTNTLLTRYAGFLLQKSGADISFITQMKSVLDSVNIKSPVNMTTDNINLQLSKNENKTRLQWIYVEDDIIMNYKRLEMDFNGNDSLVSFQDTWSLYNKIAKPTITKEQATKIALDAAQKVIINTSTAEGKIVTVETPDLSNAPYAVQFGMVPCNNVEKDFSLDPLTLYPFWRFLFYFNETIAGADGIQVGVLGDTGTVYSSGIFGYLGGGYPTTTIDAFTDASPTDNISGLLIFVAVITILILIVSIPIALRHKIRKRK